MQCPKCNSELLASVREEIEIDCCPQCGGIWLDHGELMKIIMAYAPKLPDSILNMPVSTSQSPSGEKERKAV